jgi:hypothetical protein
MEKNKESTLKKVFCLPATIVMILLVAFFGLLDMLFDENPNRFLFWETRKNETTDDIVDRILDSTAPYEYAFSTIFWILLIKFLFL